jgi:glycosyltransferase involved in cell wall biosynthesis
VTDLAVVSQDPRFGGGAVAQTEAFVRAATELGHEPIVVHPRFVPLFDALAELAQVPRVARAVRNVRNVWVVAAAAPYGVGALRSGRPYAAWIGTSLDDEWSARRHGLAPTRRVALALNAPLLRWFERRVLRGARRLYATSPASRAALAAAAGVEPETIEILPIPVDTELFRPEPDDEWLQRLDAPTVAFVGRADDPRKNVSLLLDAWPAVHAAVPGARLRLIGRAPVQELPAGADAVGEVASVAAELRSASLLILPSLQEGFGIIVAEALASGVPAVVTPSGGPEELVRASRGGVVLEDFAPETLADAVTGLLADEPRIVSARGRGREYVESRHSPEQFRRQLAAILTELGDG